MKNLAAETETNFGAFDRAWPKEMLVVLNGLAANADRFLLSYRRVATLQAWRTLLLQQKLDEESLRFFLEAQNDALYSHVLARMGAWRASLQSLRSTIENVLATMYYMDHPVERSLWLKGDHRMDFQEYLTYFGKHPAVKAVGFEFAGLATLKSEYAVLSRAVHGSAEPFRMTGSGGETKLWLSDIARLGAWGTRESKVILSLNRLLMTLFVDEVKGAKLPGLRKAISLTLSPPDRQEAKDILGINLPKP